MGFRLSQEYRPFLGFNQYSAGLVDSREAQERAAALLPDLGCLINQSYLLAALHIRLDLEAFIDGNANPLFPCVVPALCMVKHVSTVHALCMDCQELF
jgi:hypothetical protein